MSSDSVERPADDVGVLTKTYRSVRPPYASHPDAEMNSIGWAMFLGILVLLVPLLPFLVIVWVLERGLRAVLGRGGD